MQEDGPAACSVRGKREKDGSRRLFLRKKILNAFAFRIVEVTPRFELGNEGFADPCLTTWLCHHI